jgi:bifunctional UDP-N-acetylglucosamine pyrophosphorylase/glucosamine-1-phosphate N-acetyltransferase
MYSDQPKVLHTLAGKPLLSHVIDTARRLDSKSVNVVIGHGAVQVREVVDGPGLGWVVQEQQLGTGHAVAQTLDALSADRCALVLYGDVPLISAETLAALVENIDANTLGLLTVDLPDPTGYGRIVRNEANEVVAIVEQKDASPEELAITEINTGIMAIPVARLHEWLPQLENNNAQGEYYLTDVIAMAANAGCRIVTWQPDNPQEVEGVNNRLQLATLERWHQGQLANRLMMQGLSLLDPDRFDLRGELTVGRDCRIDINAVLEGEVSLGDRVVIGPNVTIRNARIGNDVEILANTVIDEAEVGDNCSVGPFARLRPGTRLAEKAKVGNFVETKKANIGPGSKLNHLTYVGDAEVGSDVNIGAGTITCNYDGANKFKTEIDDGVFVGSNTAIVAPAKIGKNATIGAGSVVTSDVPDNNLAVARAKQRNIDSWQRPVKKQEK